jgi:mannitol-1-phosphate/altronate dehydrogenase
MTRAAEQLRRLSAATRDIARAGSVATYERPRNASITHLGVGAFPRAYLAVDADDLLNLGIPAAIRGVSLHSITAQEPLEPQDGYYTVVEREADAAARLRVIGAFNRVPRERRRRSPH